MMGFGVLNEGGEERQHYYFLDNTCNVRKTPTPSCYTQSSHWAGQTKNEIRPRTLAFFAYTSPIPNICGLNGKQCLKYTRMYILRSILFQLFIISNQFPCQRIFKRKLKRRYCHHIEMTDCWIDTRLFSVDNSLFILGAAIF